MRDDEVQALREQVATIRQQVAEATQLLTAALADDAGDETDETEKT